MSSTAIEPSQGRGFFENLADLYTAPAVASKSIVARPAFLKPLLVLVALNIAFTMVWFQKVDTVGFFRAQNEQTSRWRDLPAEQKAQTIEAQSRFLKPFGGFMAVAGAPLLMLLVGSFYLFVFRFFLASDLTFRQSLAIVTWSFLAVALVSTPLTLVTMFLKGDWTLDPSQVLQASLAAVLDPATAPKALYALARSLDLFVFWVLFLFWSGYREASGGRGGAVAAALGIPWLLLVMGKMALAAVF
jgi:Yip1 domain